MRVSPAPCAKHMSYGPLPASKSARITSQDVSLKSSAVPPPTQNLTKRLVTPVTTAMEATRATPPTLEDLAATPTARATRATLPTLEDLAVTPTARTERVVEMARVIAAITPTVLTDTHGRDWLAHPSLLAMPRRPLLGPPLLSHQHRVCLPPRGRVLVRMAARHRACSHPRERALVPNDVRAPCPHRRLHLALQPLRLLSAVTPPLR